MNGLSVCQGGFASAGAARKLHGCHILEKASPYGPGNAVFVAIAHLVYDTVGGHPSFLCSRGHFLLTVPTFAVTPRPCSVANSNLGFAPLSQDVIGGQPYAGIPLTPFIQRRKVLPHDRYGGVDLCSLAGVSALRRHSPVASHDDVGIVVESDKKEELWDNRRQRER